MSITCICKETLPDSLRKQIRINHKLYCGTHKLSIDYIDNINDTNINDNSVLVISEYHIFFNIEYNFNQLIINDNFLFLPLKNNTIQHISNTTDDAFIIKQSEWSSLLLQQIGQYNSIIEYLHSKIDISSVDKLQNIEILPAYFRIFLHQFINNPFSKISPLLINISDVSCDIAENNVLAINKHLGVVYVNS